MCGRDEEGGFRFFELRSEKPERTPLRSAGRDSNKNGGEDRSLPPTENGEGERKGGGRSKSPPKEQKRS